MNFIDYFNLPKTALLRKRIHFNALYALCTPIQRKYLDQRIDSIYLVALIDEQTTRLRRFVVNDYHYETIQVFQIETTSAILAEKTYELLHALFPNPSIFYIQNNLSFQYSIAKKRLSLIDDKKTTIEEMYHSSKLSNNVFVYSLLSKLDLSKMKPEHQKHYFDFVFEILSYVQFIEMTDFIPPFERLDAYWYSMSIKLRDFRKIKMHLTELYNKTDNLSKQMDVHMLIKKNQQEIDKLILEMKEK
jgi:hypothetical protein